jgi:peroxiredoxin Q/BCP
MDVASPRFRAHGATIVAVSGDRPGDSRARQRAFGAIELPLLSDPDHAVALAYGAWRPAPGAAPEDGEPVHGTFLVGRDGRVRWVHVGDRPFADIDALLAELRSLEGSTARSGLTPTAE